MLPIFGQISNVPCCSDCYSRQSLSDNLHFLNFGEISLASTNIPLVTSQQLRNASTFELTEFMLQNCRKMNQKSHRQHMKTEINCGIKFLLQ